MKRWKALTPALTLAASVVLAPSSKASGFIVVDPVVGGGMRPPIIMPPVIPGHPVVPGHPVTPGMPVPGTRPILKGGVSFGLHMQSEQIKVDITDQVAKTYITQTFMNDTDQNLAGTYLFPLPEDTTFSSFSLHIDGKPVEGKILEAQEARNQYEAIVRSMVDPGLLEYADYKTVRARIFPIPAHGTKKVELEYTQVLHAENGMLKYRFPLKAEGETAPIDEVKIDAKLNSKQGLRTIWSPTHTITSKRSDNNQAKISMLTNGSIPDKDFLLYYSVSNKDLAANLLTHKNEGEDGYFLLTLTPPVQSNQVIGKDIVLIADTSGSMQGDKIVQSKKALKYIVNALNADDKFSIVQFNTDVDSFKSQIVAATPENKKAADAFIDEMEARGGTNISDALHTGMTMLNQATDRPGYVVMMTDGEPTVGETNVETLLKSIAPKRDTRIFDFGVGYDVNTKLLNRLAEDHHGTAQYVEPSENLETALSSFYQKIKSPVLSNVSITYNGEQVKDVYPREVKDIFAGSQVLLIGKYKSGGKATVNLTGKVNGVAKAFSFPLTFESNSADHTYLPRLWAMRRIAHLTEVAQANGDNREVVDEIVALSKKYGIISNYTSFLVTDPSETHGSAMNRRTPVAFNGSTMPPMQWQQAPVRRGGGGGGAGSIAAGTSTPVRGRLMRQVAMAPSAPPPAWGMIPPPPAVTMSTQTSLDSFVRGSADASAIYGDEGVHGLPPTSMGKFVHQPGDNQYSASAGTHQHYAHYEPHGYYKARTPEIQIIDDKPTIRDYRSAQTEVGEKAVMRQKKLNEMKSVDVIAKDEEAGGGAIKTVEDKTFYFKGDMWVDSTYTSSMKPQVIQFGSKEYFDLIHANAGISKYLAVGKELILVFKGHCYKIVSPSAS